MIVDKISLYNFKKYKKADIDFKKDIMGIFGNNGAGKSTIFDGITWALYGRTQVTDSTGVTQADLIRDGEERMGVELFFSLGGSAYRVSRYLDKRGINTKLWANNKIQATKTREAEEMVQRVLGLDFKAFVASSFIRQKEIDLLSSKRPSERRGIINRLFNLRIYEKFEKHAKEKRKSVEVEITSLGGKREIFQREIEQIDPLVEERRTLQNAVDTLFATYKKTKDDLDEKENTLKLLEKEKKIYDDDLKRKELLIEKRESRRKHVATLEGDLKEIRDAEKAYEEREPEYIAYRDLKKSFRELEEKRERYTHLVTQLKIEESTWDTTLSNMRSNMKKLKKQGENSKERIQVLREKTKDLPKIREKIKEYRSIDSKIKEKKEKIEKITKKITDIGQRLTKYETEKEGLAIDLNAIRGVGVGKNCPLCKRELDEEHYRALVSEYTEKIGKKDTEISKISKKEENAKSLLNEEREELLVLRSDLQKLEKLREEARDLGSIESEITRVKEEAKRSEEEREKLRKDKENSIIEKNKKIDAIRKKIDQIDFEEKKFLQIKKELEKNEDIEKDVSVLKEKISKKEELQERVSVITEELKRIEKSLRTLTDDIAKRKQDAEEYEELRSGMEKLRKTYLELSEKYTAKSTELKSLERRIKELKEKKKELKNLKQKIKEKKEKKREYSILSEAFSDIAVHIQNRLNPRIAFETARLVNEMTEGKYTEIALDEDYGIHVGYDNELHPISRFSGGERDMINLCLRIAISRVLVSLSSEHGFSHIHSLFLDEAFSSLDTERRQSLLQTLHTLRNYFGQILIITHVEDIKRSVPNGITVEETPEGYSIVKRV